MLSNIANELGMTYNNAPYKNWQPISSLQDAAPAAGPADVNSGYDAAAAARTAAYNQANANLNREEGRIDPQFEIAKSNLLDQYNAARNALTGQKNRAVRDYTTATDRTNQGRTENVQSINQNASNQYSGLMRLLGSRGAGASSAAQILAPYAVGQLANKQRGDIQRTYGMNMQDINTKQGDFLQDWQNKYNQTETDQANSLRELEGKRAQARLQIAQQRQQLDPYNAASYNSRINDLVGQIDQLARVSTYNAPTAAYIAPQLKDYQYQAPGGINQNKQVGEAAQQNVGPYYSLIGEDQKKEQVM